MNRFTYFLKSNKYIIAILLVGLFLRAYKFDEWFAYGHDQDLAGWFIKDVLENKHLRLIGQETSTQGIFIGPLYYYLLIPFYLLFNMDPIGGVVFITLFGLFTIASVYYVFLKVFGKQEALIASFIYATAYIFFINDRRVVPTTPVITWTIWFLFSINLILQKKQKNGLVLIGILTGFIWHLNFALVLLLSSVPLAFLLSRQKPKLKNLLYSVLIFAVASTPLILFELRHGFIQTNALVQALTSNQERVVSGVAKVARVIHLTSFNIKGLFGGSIHFIASEIITLVLLLLFAVLRAKRILSNPISTVLSWWLVVYIVFFSIYSKIVSEYYLDGISIVWLIILTLTFSEAIKNKRFKLVGVLLLVVFAYINISSILKYKTDGNGYVPRTSIVNIINEDAKDHGYPCVSVSYITKPGYQFGYRYLYWLENMHVNTPDSESPVYTIVFPLRDDIEVDETVVATGLIYPNYERYNEEGVKHSCSGENANITEPMWGMPI